MKKCLHVLCSIFLAVLCSLYSHHVHRFFQLFSPLEQHRCRAPLPPLLIKDPPPIDHPSIQSAARKLEKALNERFTQGGFDSIAVAVVTSNGSVYEGFWGALHANETDEARRGRVDRYSVYRLASISKLFTALETLILRDRGVVNLDDRITRIFPELTYTPDDDPITLRQLMSHMSGLGKDWPPGSSRSSWPKSLNGSDPPPYNGLPFPNHRQFMEGIAHNRLVMHPYTFPSYSNTGYSLLGLANVAANRAIEGYKAPHTHADLVSRDIFAPLGFNGSSFAITEENRAHIVVASVEPWESDVDFGDATNPAGGQMSSLADFVKLLPTLIDPSRTNALLSPYTIREWLRPMHTWWDDYSEVGALWEIFQSSDSYRRKLRLFSKLGELIGHHTMLTINPASSFGVVILTTGPSMQTLQLNKLIFSYFQPAFDSIIEEMTRQLIVGSWLSADMQCDISISIDSGSLYVYSYVLNGTDVLKTIHSDQVSRPAALWSTGVNEFRLAAGSPDTGCMFQWMAFDQYGYDRGSPTNLLRLVGEGEEMRLFLPAVDIILFRK